MTPTPPPSHLLDSAGHLHADVPCHHCRYNLRTLAAAANCPECATPVALSLRHFDPHHFNPLWIRQLQRGVASSLVGTFLFFIACLFHHDRGYAPLLDVATILPLVFAVSIYAAMFTALLIGVWNLTAPPQPPFARPLLLDPAWRSRVCCLSAWTLAILLTPIIYDRSWSGYGLIEFTLHLCLVCLTLGIAGILIRFAHLARRARLPLLCAASWLATLFTLVLGICYFCRVIAPLNWYLDELLYHLWPNITWPPSTWGSSLFYWTKHHTLESQRLLFMYLLSLLILLAAWRWRLRFLASVPQPHPTSAATADHPPSN